MPNVYDSSGQVIEESYSPVFAATGESYSPVYEDTSFLEGVANRMVQSWETAKTGAHDLVRGLSSPTSNAIGNALGYNDPSLQTPSLPMMDTLLAPLKLLGGAMGVASPVSQVGEEAAYRAWRGLGEPGGEWGRTGAELLGGVIGGLGDAKLLSKVPGIVTKKYPSAFKTVEEMAPVRATEITPLAGQGAHTIEDLGATQGKLFPLERKPAAGRVEQLGQSIKEYVDPETQSKINQLESFLNKNLSDSEREWALSEIESLQRKTKYARSSDILPMEEDPGALITGGKYTKASTGNLFSKEVPEIPGEIIRGKEKVLGHAETGLTKEVLDPAQFTQEGLQKELFKDLKRAPIYSDAEKEHVARTTYNALMDKTTDTAGDPGFWHKIQNTYLKSTGLLVTAPQTGFRNFLNQMVKYGLEVPVRALQEIYTSGSFENAWKKAAAQLSSLYDSRKLDDELEHAVSRLSKEQRAQLASKGMYGEFSNLKTQDWYEGSLGKVAQKANYLNAKQEELMWNANFVASVNADLAPQGLKLGRGVSAGQLPQDVIDRAFTHANEMTYALNPDWYKEWQGALKVPGLGVLLNEAAPFARFNYANALRDIIDFSPAGFLKASFNKNKEEAARQLAKSVMGTKIIEQVARMKQSTDSNVWEIDVPGYGRVDSRKWFPLSAYVLLGEMINRPPGSPNSRTSLEDASALLMGGTRLDDTVIGLLASMSDQTFESSTQSLADSVGQMIARWTTPLKWGQDAYALATGDPKVMADRDIMARSYGPGGILDRAMANVPGLRQLLPERIDPTLETTPGPQSRMDYVKRMTGLDPVRTNELKTELNRLKFTGPQGQEALNRLESVLGVTPGEHGEVKSSVSAGDFQRKFYASTGDKELNRKMNTMMRDLVTPKLMEFIQSDQYRSLPVEMRRFLMNEILQDAREGIGEAATAKMSPAKQMQQLLRERRPTERGLLDYTVR